MDDALEASTAQRPDAEGEGLKQRILRLRAPVCTITLLALLPLSLFVVAGYKGDDLEIHVSSWMELHKAWSAHEWPLGWAQWAQYGLGEPRFCFYPPLSIIAGAALSFLMPFLWVPGFTAWLVLMLAGLSMYKAAGSFGTREHQLSAAVLYMFNPYLLVTVLVRFAIAEAWVQALLPLTFLYFYQAVAGYRLRQAGIAALLLATGWLTNIPEAIAIFYAFNGLAIALAIRNRSIRPIFMAVLSGGTAIGLAAFRLLPAMRERIWISSDRVFFELYSFRQYMLLAHGSPSPKLVYFTAGYIALGIVVLVPALRQIMRRGTAWQGQALFIVLFAIYPILLYLPFSTPIWEALPQFQYVEFPFRLLPFLTLAIIHTLTGSEVSAATRKSGVTYFLMGTLLTMGYCALPTRFSFRHFSIQQFQMWHEHSLAAEITDWPKNGYEGMPEFVPAGVAATEAVPAREKEDAKQGPFATPDCNPILLHATPNTRLIRTDSVAPCTLVVRTFYYPFWKAYAEDGLSMPVVRSLSGLLQLDVPKDSHMIRLSFVPASPLRTGSMVVSMCTLLLLLLWIWMTRNESGEHSLESRSD